MKKVKIKKQVIPGKNVKAKKQKIRKKLKEVIEMPSSKNVNIKQANNGYVVSSWGDKGEVSYIAKTKKEAERYTKKILKM